MRIRFALLPCLFAAAAACGPNAAELNRAREAHYHGDPGALLQAAEAATTEHYPIDETDAENFAFVTTDKVYSAEGVTESAGTGGAIQMTDRSIVLSFSVQVVTADGASTIVIVPHIHRAYTDRSNTDELAPDDPSVPGWVHGRVDDPAIAIHDALAANEVKAP